MLATATKTPPLLSASLRWRSRQGPRSAQRCVAVTAFFLEKATVELYCLNTAKLVEPPVIDAEGCLARARTLFLPSNCVARQVAEAGKYYGCFQFVNHGLDQELLDSLKRVMRSFFALPLGEKLKVKRNPTNPNGFFNDEYTKQTLDLKEAFDFCHEIDASLPGFTAPNQWPEGQEEFREVMSTYLAEMSRVSFKLLEAFSLGLGLPANTLCPTFEEAHTSFMRLNYYPATPASQKAMGLNHHTDAGFLTILVQDPLVHGLEFFKDDEWRSITPAPNTLTINVGDQAQVLTNDILKAPVHRVRSPHNLGRYSAPFFFNPRADAVIAPLPAFVTAEAPALYKPIPWREFRELRFAGDYADLGQEVQIYHYKQ